MDIALVKVNEEFKVGISGKLLLPGKNWKLPCMVHFFSIISLDVVSKLVKIMYKSIIFNNLTVSFEFSW